MALGDYMGASCHACIGGTNVRAEVQKLQMEAPHIIVGTPGRVLLQFVYNIIKNAEDLIFYKYIF